LFKRISITIADVVMQNRRPTERIFADLIFLSIIMTFIFLTRYISAATYSFSCYWLFCLLINLKWKFNFQSVAISSKCHITYTKRSRKTTEIVCSC